MKHDQEPNMLLPISQVTMKPGMTTELMVITPAQAAEFLKGNRENRPMRQNYVSFLAAAIARGEWKVTHQGIALASDGRLLDGQHRCAAIVSSGLSVPMNVSFDCDPASFIVLDTGAKRSAAYALGMKNTDVGAVRWLVALTQTSTPAPQNVSATQVQSALPWAYPPIAAIRGSVSSTRKVATSSPVLAGVALRLAITDDRESVLSAFRAFVLLQYSDIPPSVQILERQIATRTAGMSMPRMLLIKAFTAFDLARGDKNLVFKDESFQLDRLHEIALSMSRASADNRVAAE